MHEQGEAPKVYVYDDSGDDLEVFEYDEDGDLVRRYRYDPDGVLVDPAPGAGAPGATGAVEDGDSTGPTTPPEEPEEKDGGGSPLPWVMAGVVALGLGLAGAWWWSRRRPSVGPEVVWTEVLVARLEAHGVAHGRTRAGDETIVAYTSALEHDVLPDPRLAAVGTALSAALFGPAAPQPGEEARLTGVVDEIIEAHPVPTRAERRRVHTA